MCRECVLQLIDYYHIQALTCLDERAKLDFGSPQERARAVAGSDGRSAGEWNSYWERARRKVLGLRPVRYIVPTLV